MSKKRNYEELAKRILTEVGGKENVMHVAHCATRLRFNLKDESIPNDEKLKALSGVIGVMHAGGQLQIIIGQDVSILYSEVCKIGNFGADIKLSNTSENEKKKITLKSIGNGILDALSGSLTPAIPIITIAAFFKMIAAILGPSMLNLITETSDLYVLATFVGDAGFYFFPVIIGYTSAKKFKTNPLLGILLGCIMLHPTFMKLVEEGSSFSVFGIPSIVENYSSTMIPIIMSVWVMSYVERFFNKYIPSAIRSVLAPALTIAVMLPITLCVVGPAGAWVGTSISQGILNLNGVAGFLGVALIGATFELLVLTGMHIILITALIQTFMINGSESFVAPGMAAATFAVAGICLGAALKLRDKDEKSLSWGYFVSLILGGITEPGLYGVAIRYKKPLIAMMAGGFAGGLYFGILNIGHYTLIPVTNIISLLCFTGHTTANTIHGIIGCLIALIVSAAVTYFFGFSNEEAAVKNKSKKDNKSIVKEKKLMME